MNTSESRIELRGDVFDSARRDQFLMLAVSGYYACSCGVITVVSNVEPVSAVDQLNRSFDGV